VADYASATTTAPSFTYDSSGNVSNSFTYSTGRAAASWWCA
jgi:hypothetical protein